MSITDELLIESLQSVIAEAPDTVYAPPDHMRDGYGSCYYVHTDEYGENPTPGCVVAHALTRAGVPLLTLAEWEGNNAQAAMSGLHIGGWEMRRLFRLVQNAQDHGKPWGAAFAEARDRLS